MDAKAAGAYAPAEIFLISAVLISPSQTSYKRGLKERKEGDPVTDAEDIVQTVFLKLLDENIPFRQEEERGLFAAVMALPAKYRVVVHLHYYEGYTLAEIAGLPLSTVFGKISALRPSQRVRFLHRPAHIPRPWRCSG